MIKSTAFYPEYFPEQIAENYQKIKEGGIQAIRFGEFAWGHIEPEEGRFHFAVYDRAFALAEAYGLQIILCTPTACPPVWLTEKYPGILPVNDLGHTVDFGARQHRCYHSPELARASRRVNRALSERYGKHPALLAWQIDNELGAEHKYCYCETCRRQFHAFLEEKYQTIDALNERWFTTFWSQNFNSFSQIPLPKRLDAYLPMKPHPSLMYEYLRFSSDSVIQFAKAQAADLRLHSDRPITTNQDDFYYGDNVDWYKLYRTLDFVAYDIYTDRLYEIGFYDDLARCVKNKPFWQMEFSTNSPILTQALDMHVEKGGEGFGLFAFNPFPAGQEQGMFGLVNLFGQVQPNYPVFRDWQPPATAQALTSATTADSAPAMAATADSASETAATPDSAPDSATTPATTAVPGGKPLPKARLLYDFESAWVYNVMEYHTWEMGYPQIFSRLVYKDCLIHQVYKALFTGGYAVDVTNSLDGACVDEPLYMPLHIVYKEDLADSLLDFINRGGRVTTTVDLFTKNGDNAYHRSLPDFFIKLGLSVSYPNPGDCLTYGHGKIRFLDTKTDADGWMEAVRPSPAMTGD